MAISADGKHAYVTLEMTGEVAELALTADGAHVRTLHAMTPEDFFLALMRAGVPQFGMKGRSLLY